MSRFRSNFLWSLFGNGIYAGCQWVILLVLVKWGGDDVVGRYTLALAITAPFFLFTNLSLRSLVVTDAWIGLKFGHFARVRLFTSMLAWVGSLSVLLFTNYSPEIQWLILIVACAKLSESFSDLVYGLCVQQERLRQMSTSLIARGALSVTVVVIVMYFFKHLVWSITMMTLVWWGVFLVYDWFIVVRKLGASYGVSTLKPKSSDAGKADESNAEKQSDDTTPLDTRKEEHNIHLTPNDFIDPWSFHSLFTIVRRGFPLGFSMLLLSLNVQIPRYFIESLWGEAALGVFATLITPATFGGMLITALMMSSISRLSQLFTLRDIKGFWFLFVRLFGMTLVISAVGLVVAYFFGKPILGFLFRPDYAQHHTLFLWLVLFMIATYIGTIAAYAMNACLLYKQQPLIYSCSLLVTGGLSWWLIPTYGLVGAAWTIIGATTVQFVLAMIFLTRALRKVSHELLEEAKLNPVETP